MFEHECDGHDTVETVRQRYDEAASAWARIIDAADIAVMVATLALIVYYAAP